MTSEVFARKLTRLRTCMDDLRPHAGKSADEVFEARYEIERLLELMVQVAVVIVSHELAQHEVVPETYRGAFLIGGERGLIMARIGFLMLREGSLVRDADRASRVGAGEHEARHPALGDEPRAAPACIVRLRLPAVGIRRPDRRRFSAAPATRA